MGCALLPNLLNIAHRSTTCGDRISREAFMRKSPFLVFAAALLLAIAAFAGDPWKDKSYDQWDAKETQKILNDSPWARSVDIGAPADISGGRVPGVGIPGGTSGNDELNGTGLSGGGGGRGGRRGGADNVPSGGGRQLHYVAVWSSSRTVRAADVRRLQLSGRPADEAMKRLNSEPDTYQVIVMGADLAPFAGMNEDALKQATYLEMKKSHQHVAPVSAHAISSDTPRGARITALVFDFPKKATGGEPSIAADEKNVDVVTAGDKLTLKFHYDVSKMTDKNGADL
jgi:hypothetical protein